MSSLFSNNPWLTIAILGRPALRLLATRLSSKLHPRRPTAPLHLSEWQSPVVEAGSQQATILGHEGHFQGSVTTIELLVRGAWRPAKRPLPMDSEPLSLHSAQQQRERSHLNQLLLAAH